MAPFTLCVFCGSRRGHRAPYAEAAKLLGRRIGERGWAMVYGGGRVGLMGEAADAALATGAHVTGVIPDTLMRREVGHSGLAELHVVSTMHQRKQKMAERADAFAALPGGVGTLEELFEVWSWAQLGYHDCPVGVLNTEGYFDALLRFVDHAVDEGFVDAVRRRSLIVAADVDELLDRLASQPSPRAEDFTRV